MNDVAILQVGDWIEVKIALCPSGRVVWVPAKVVATSGGRATRSVTVQLARGAILALPVFVPWRWLAEPSFPRCGDNSGTPATRPLNRAIISGGSGMGHAA